MPHHKSAIKRIRSSQRARVANMGARSSLRTAIKRVTTAEDKAAAQEALALAIPVLDKSAREGIIHKNQAARRKSRLARLVQDME